MVQLHRVFDWLVMFLNNQRALGHHFFEMVQEGVAVVGTIQVTHHLP